MIAYWMWREAVRPSGIWSRGGGRTIEKADVDTGIADAGSQGFPDLEVGVRGIFQISGEKMDRSAESCACRVCFDGWARRPT
jgi:hypothetical protein